MFCDPSENIRIEELSEEEKGLLTEKNFTVLIDWVRVKPSDLILPRLYGKMYDKIQKFEFREGDVVLLSYPKTGTTWMAEILWAMTSIDKLHLAEEQAIIDRVYMIHYDIMRPAKKEDDTPMMRKFRVLFPEGDVDDGVTLQLAKVAPDRRVIRTHLLPSLLNPDLLRTCKVVCLLRNPKDTCLSSYNFYKDLESVNYQGTFQDIFDAFVGGYMPCGSYWNFVREMWHLRHEPNLHFVFYEDLKEDLKAELEKLNDFFQFHLKDEQILKVCSHVTLENMKRREKKAPFLLTTRGTFFGEGKTGGWKKAFTLQMHRRMDQWIEEQSKGIDLKFKYE